MTPQEFIALSRYRKFMFRLELTLQVLAKDYEGKKMSPRQLIKEFKRYWTTAGAALFLHTLKGLSKNVSD